VLSLIDVPAENSGTDFACGEFLRNSGRVVSEGRSYDIPRLFPASLGREQGNNTDSIVLGLADVSNPMHLLQDLSPYRNPVQNVGARLELLYAIGVYYS
jgi:hypothetical protein